jgi:SAM-dependent methyltransferase
VSILAPTLAQLSARTCFDAIALVDVIEHVADPGDLLDQALLHLAPGGSLIIATGDAGNLLCRKVFRSRFWYSSFREHITFPSLRYLHIWHVSKGLRTPTSIRLKYRRIPLWKAAFHFASQVAYLVSPWLLNCVGRGIEWLRRAPRPRRRFFSPGASGWREVIGTRSPLRLKQLPRDLVATAGSQIPSPLQFDSASINRHRNRVAYCSNRAIRQRAEQN